MIFTKYTTAQVLHLRHNKFCQKYYLMMLIGNIIFMMSSLITTIK